MDKSYQTALVVIPSEVHWQPIQEIRRKYDRHYERWMPHINLLFPFLPDKKFEQAADQLGPVCAEIEPFSLSLNSLNTFRQKNEKHTFWLQPEPAEPLHELQKKVEAVFPECNDVSRFSKGFEPHLTLGQIMGPDNAELLRPILENCWQPITFEVNSIYLIARENHPRGQFRAVKTVELKRDEEIEPKEEPAAE